MYDIYFQGVNMKEVNESSALTDTSNRISYNDMIVDDQYWWDTDDELRHVLYETEYNIIESKYIGVHVMYRLTEMIHEVARFFRLVIDNKEYTRALHIQIYKIKSDVPLTYLETIVLAICLICKRNKMRGEIITTPSKTLSVLGFNFRADFDLIRKQLDDNKDLIEHEKIYNLIKDLSMSTVSDVNQVYGNIKELWNFLIDKMSRAKTIEEFEAYEKLYKTLHYTDDLSTVFTMSNGKVAETYLEFLEDLNEDLALFVETSDDQDILIALEAIIYSLENEIENLEYLNILNEGNSIMTDALRTLVMFFKSYTIDLKHMSIIYVMDNRYYNMIKLISQIKNIDAQLTVGDTMDSLTHKLHSVVEMLKSDDLGLRTDARMSNGLLLESLAKLIDKISLSVASDNYDSVRLSDVEFVSSDIAHTMSVELKDTINRMSEIVHGDTISGKDKAYAKAESIIASNGKLDDLSHIDSIIRVSSDDKAVSRTKAIVESVRELKSLINFNDNCSIDGKITNSELINYHDTEHISSGIDLGHKINDNLLSKHELLIIREE